MAIAVSVSQYGTGHAVASLEAVADLVRLGVARGVGLGVGERDDQRGGLADARRRSPRERAPRRSRPRSGRSASPLEDQEVDALAVPGRRRPAGDVEQLDEHAGRERLAGEPRGSSAAGG